MTTYRTPYPYFGGKSRIAATIWQRFGSVCNFVDPFFGGGSLLLRAPWPADRIETVNDVNGLLCNFWRALQADPEAVALYCDYPVSEIDLHSRHAWLVNQKADVQRLLADPDWYDAKIAGWWVWGACCWIGSGWCDADSADTPLPRKRPTVAGGGARPHVGHIPHVGDSGRGIFRKIPDVSRAGPSLHGSRRALHIELAALSVRLRRVRIVSGDFARVVTPAVTTGHGLTAVILDPPYDMCERERVYSHEDATAAERAYQWAVAHGDHPLLRIAYCGYDVGRVWPPGWTCVPWKANGGFGNQSQKRGRTNASRERVWFSPHCLQPQHDMFAFLEEMP